MTGGDEIAKQGEKPSVEDLMKALADQSKTDRDQASLATLMSRVMDQNPGASAQNSNGMSMATVNVIESRIQEFVYSPEDGSTFERWWNRHEDIFEIDLKEWDEVKKMRLLIRHVSTSVERTFIESIAPKKWIEMTLMEVKETMITLFGDNTSTFDRRRTMLDLKMSKENIQDVRVLAARVNQTIENAQERDASIDEWKVITFLHALDLPRYSDEHLKMMQTAKTKGKECTLNDLLSVYNDISPLKKDSRTITDSNREVYAVYGRDKRFNRSRSADSETSQEGTTACGRCGSEEHDRSKCPFQTYKCNRCGYKGHLARVCKKGKKVYTVKVASLAECTYRIQLQINGQTTSMSIDTGADVTIIPEKLWKQLGMPDCKATFGTVACANGDDLNLKGRFTARMEYGGISATSDVYVTHDRSVSQSAKSDETTGILGNNFITLLQLVKVRAPVTSVNEQFVAQTDEQKKKPVFVDQPDQTKKAGFFSQSVKQMEKTVFVTSTDEQTERPEFVAQSEEQMKKAEFVVQSVKQTGTKDERNSAQWSDVSPERVNEGTPLWTNAEFVYQPTEGNDKTEKSAQILTVRPIDTWIPISEEVTTPVSVNEFTTPREKIAAKETLKQQDKKKFIVKKEIVKEDIDIVFNEGWQDFLASEEEDIAISCSMKDDSTVQD